MSRHSTATLWRQRCGGPAGPAALLNDADAAAVAEARHHDEGRDGRMLMVTLGTGVGVAMVVAGQPLETAGGTLGDSGHLNVDPAGRLPLPRRAAPGAWNPSPRPRRWPGRDRRSP